jgi:hypothetical protein
MRGRPIARTVPLRRHLIRHYIEMVLAMAAGMAVYGMLFRRGIAWTGYRDEIVMAAFMTVPMVALMRYRRHTWRQAAEMAAAMLIPTAVVVIAGVELLGITGRTLGMSSHAAMLVGMLGWLLLRRADYGHGAHAARAAHGTHLHARPETAPLAA